MDSASSNNTSGVVLAAALVDFCSEFCSVINNGVALAMHVCSFLARCQQSDLATNSSRGKYALMLADMLDVWSGTLSSFRLPCDGTMAEYLSQSLQHATCQEFRYSAKKRAASSDPSQEACTSATMPQSGVADSSAKPWLESIHTEVACLETAIAGYLNCCRDEDSKTASQKLGFGKDDDQTCAILPHCNDSSHAELVDHNQSGVPGSDGGIQSRVSDGSARLSVAEADDFVAKAYLKHYVSLLSKLLLPNSHSIMPPAKDVALSPMKCAPNLSTNRLQNQEVSCETSNAAVDDVFNHFAVGNQSDLAAGQDALNEATRFSESSCGDTDKSTGVCQSAGSGPDTNMPTSSSASEEQSQPGPVHARPLLMPLPFPPVNTVWLNNAPYVVVGPYVPVTPLSSIGIPLPMQRASLTTTSSSSSQPQWHQAVPIQGIVSTQGPRLLPYYHSSMQPVSRGWQQHPLQRATFVRTSGRSQGAAMPPKSRKQVAAALRAQARGDCFLGY